MSAFHLRTIRVIAAMVGIAISTLSIVHALQPRSESSRFDRLVVADPSVVVSPAPVPADSATLPESLRGRWSSFEAGSGKTLDVTIDTRSGVPMLVQGEGIPMIPGSGNTIRAAAPVTLDSLAAMLRSFVTANASLSLTADAELTLNREGSGQLTPNLWKVIFDRTVGGVPVAGDRWIFFVGHGNLIAFGATRWSTITSPTVPAISPEAARTMLFEYMGLGGEDRTSVVEKPSLVLVPMAAAGTAIDSYAGSIGGGYQTALAWRLSVEVAGEPGKWTSLVDARSGRILSLEDTIQYAQVKGGVQPVTGDGICPSGCEKPNYPLPFADITIAGSPSTASSMGLFTCAPTGSNATTTLTGQYVRVVDSCGAISQSVACNDDLNLSVSSATNCSSPGGGAGNTRAARSSFYHLNRVKEHAKVWLPNNNWLPLQLRNNVNLNNTCNAFWSSGGLNGTVNFYRAGGGCGNTGEIAAMFLHEWGHGLDQNDGGGYDNPSEAYGDVTAFVMTRLSCIGRGFHGSNCGGYGNACENCSGVRDQDWDEHAAHAPQTPANWPAGCPEGSGPCGREVHCESYLSGQTVWDLAVRDLPASGLDPATSWQILDRLWFASRSGSGGNAYTCGATVANRSCTANSWYTSFRTIDDDDGNLANGTPHAAAIFNAFDRHEIPCGTAADATNQSFTTCPPLPSPTVTATPSTGQVSLSWTAVPGAASYNVLRNDQGCDWAYTLVANVPGTSYTDIGLPNVFPVYYTIQPVGANSSCQGAVSTCTTASAGGPHLPFSPATLLADTCGTGGVGNNNSIYDPGEQIQFSLAVRNDGVTTLTGVTVTVTPTTPGVIMLDDTATIGSIAAATNGVSNPPHFSAKLPENLACNSTLDYDVTIDANEGSWTDSFSQVVGGPNSGNGTAVSENFASGIPATWTIVDGGTGGGPAATWTAANPGNRVFPPAMSVPAAIVDSNLAGANQQDEQLITPVMNLATATSVTLVFDEFFRVRNVGLVERGDVDVRSSQTAGQWVNVLRNENVASGTTSLAAHRTVNITAQAAGAPDAQVRFRYYNATNDHYWMIDNILITYASPPSCATNPCLSPCTGAPDGTSCDDASECTTDDECQGGTCAGSPVGGPPEVTELNFTSKTNRSWAASTATVQPTTYDVVRGALGEGPVGGGASENCLVSETPDTFVDLADDPAGNSGYWYLVRGRNACGVGTYGSASVGTERITAICP